MSGQDSLIDVGSGNGEPHMKSRTNDDFKTHAVISERFKIIQHRFIADDRPQRCKASIVCFRSLLPRERVRIGQEILVNGLGVVTELLDYNVFIGRLHLLRRIGLQST